MTGKFAAALIDLSGTLHIEDLAIPGAVEALRRLRTSGIRLKFVTNTTKEPLRVVHNKLVQLGFDIDHEEIFTSLTAARRFVDARGFRPFLLMEESAKEDFKGISEADPNAVVVGLAPSDFYYDKLNQAFRLLLNGAPLVAIHKGRYYKKKDGLSLGPGAFVAGLEYAASVKAEIVGKPEQSFFQEAIRLLGVELNKTVMIGDDVRDDVLGAMDAGLLAILVQTGKYRQGDENTIEKPPTAVCCDFSAAVDYILNSNSTV